MSQLRSVLDELATEPTEMMTADELDADLTELLACRQRLDVIIAGRLDDLRTDDRQVDLGYPSLTAYLMHRGHRFDRKQRGF